MRGLGGDAECVGLVVRQLGADAQARLGDRAGEAITVEAEIRGTEFVVTLHDQGEPVSGPPDGVLVLLEGDLATAAEARTDGAGNICEVRFALPIHNHRLDPETVDIVPEDSELSTEDVELRPLVPADAAALTRVIYRCYGWSYPNASMYYPERIASALESGERIGEVAVTASGEIAAHWGAVFLSPNVVETGGTVTDPRFRRRGLAGHLGERLLERLVDMGVRGRMREPVMTHPATQQIALREGATIVGANICATHPIEQVGITDGLTATRGSLAVAYSALIPLTPAIVWIPPAFEPMARAVLTAASDWPRTVGTARRRPECPERSTLTLSFDSGNRLGVIDVTVIGEHLIDELQAALTQTRRAGAEYVSVRLPANQPALATVGAGLHEMRLGYASLIPEFRLPSHDGDAGDILVLQWLADTDVDTSDWVFADESVESLVLGIVEQLREAGDRGLMRQRRAAQRAQLFAPLGD